jgi:G3E family GTPase
MKVPFTILTGFLGAGKTTTLNRVLSAPQGRRIAVLVNELGRIAIDSRLILSRGGDVLELAGGCVCCKVGDDLWDGIAEVVRRSAPDHLVLETTGIAEPAAIIDGFHRIPAEQRRAIALAGLVCAVDAEDGVRQLERRDEAREQVACADRILLTKLDRATAAQAAATHQALDRLNPQAERAAFPPTADGTGALVPWLLERRTVAARNHTHAHRQGQVTAASYADPEPLLEQPLLDLLGDLGDRLLRVKGFVHVAGTDRRGYLELAGAHTSLELREPWADEAPRTELVLIGEDLDEAAVRRRLWACRAGGG